VRTVSETHELTPTCVRVTVSVDGAVDRLLVRFPALAFDGQRASRITADGDTATVQLGESRQTFRVEAPKGVRLYRTGRWVPCRNGYLEPIEGEAKGNRVVYTLMPESVGG